MQKKVYGVGINDLDDKISCGGKMLPFYQVWSGMLRRCYCKSSLKQCPTYQTATVCPEWHSLKAFKAWYDQQGDVSGMSIDKDILFIGNKVYSPETCVFVPHWVNTFIVDSAANRGKYPLGVSYNKHSKSFKVTCNHKCVGYFKDPNEGHEAWKKAKLKCAMERKAEMDAIDPRLFPAIAKRYE